MGAGFVAGLAGWLASLAAAVSLVVAALAEDALVVASALAVAAASVAVAVAPSVAAPSAALSLSTVMPFRDTRHQVGHAHTRQRLQMAGVCASMSTMSAVRRAGAEIAIRAGAGRARC